MMADCFPGLGAQITAVSKEVVVFFLISRKKHYTKLLLYSSCKAPKIEWMTSQKQTKLGKLPLPTLLCSTFQHLLVACIFIVVINFIATEYGRLVPEIYTTVCTLKTFQNHFKRDRH